MEIIRISDIKMLKLLQHSTDYIYEQRRERIFHTKKNMFYHK